MERSNANDTGELRQGFSGEILLPGEAGYEEARRIWNAMIDRHPALIARCAGTVDVARAVDFAREQGLDLAVRAGGHNIAGSALCDDGLVIDLTRMNKVRVDASARTAVVEGGALLADFDAAAMAHGLAAPLGINSTTGVAGLTLGGGFGWLSRKLGLTIDSLESAEVVTASGQVHVATREDHPDLFWALRGGGGNFGVVTRFGFRLHAVGPQLLTGLIVYPIAEAKAVLPQYRDFMAQAPDDLTVWTVLRLAPPLPFLPESIHGKGILVFAFCHAGDPGQGEALIEPLRRFGSRAGEMVAVQPYVSWQQILDPLLAPRARNYWKSHNFLDIEDGLFDAILAHVDRLPSPMCEVILGSMGGAITRIPAEATAYAQRGARFFMNVHGRWDNPSDDARCLAWARDLFQAAAPFASGGVYVNFLTGEEGDRVRAAYGPNYERLARVKAMYDPDNVFRVNQNIKPALQMAM